MDKSLYWAGHILSGSQPLFASFQKSLATPAPNSAPSQAPAKASAAAAPPDPDGLRSATMYVCALKVTAANFKIDSNDPQGSMSASIDWNNAASQQAPITAMYINQEAPAIAASDAAQYKLVWSNITGSDLTGCPTVGDVLALIQKHYS
jgi:hypothetical protein